MYNLYVLVFSNNINWNKKIITYQQWAFIYDIKGIYVYYDAHSGVQITCQIYPLNLEIFPIITLRWNNIYLVYTTWLLYIISSVVILEFVILYYVLVLFSLSP